MKKNDNLPAVLIVGGGAGGLELAVGLAKGGKVSPLLVDANRVHVWKPHLHEVAAGILNPEKEQLDYMDLARQHGFKFSRGWVESIDPTAKTATLAGSPAHDGAPALESIQLAYDHCVLAVGSTSNDFGTPGVAEHALRLDDLASANAFHERLLAVVESRERAGSSEPVSIAIVGGGATGVELAAELSTASKLLARYGHETLGKTPMKIALLNAAPALLPGMPERISKGAMEILKDRGVEVVNSAKVVAIEAGRARYQCDGADKEAKADISLWAAGVKAPETMKKFGVALNRANQAVVDGNLSTGVEGVSAMGDCCSVDWIAKPGQIVPPRAQAAHQMAGYLSKYLPEIMKGAKPNPYEYSDYGSLVSLGSSESVGTLMGALAEKSLFVEGKVAKFMYLCLYHGHQMQIHGAGTALGIMAAKGFQKRFEPKIKLH